MNHTIKMSVLAAALTLVGTACGPGAKIGGGKQGAAEALFAASQPTTGAVDRNMQPIDINFSGEVTVGCKFGGSATMKGFQLLTGTAGSTNIGQKFTLAYNNCGAVKTDVGVANFNGAFDVNQTVQAGSGAVNIAQTFKGKVTVDGAFDDFLDADISQKVSATALSATGGGVSIELVGSLETSTDKHTFNESVSVTPGNLSVLVTKN